MNYSCLFASTKRILFLCFIWKLFGVETVTAVPKAEVDEGVPKAGFQDNAPKAGVVDGIPKVGLKKGH